jgi:hypothetical protein
MFTTKLEKKGSIKIERRKIKLNVIKEGCREFYRITDSEENEEKIERKSVKYSYRV